ncbi:MAG: GNAT family N-acetyltransferase [Flavipsychrobacter sp.]|nr:GNAT family N-acetyltransferase [Flavipsychrobacter sp.]
MLRFTIKSFRELTIHELYAMLQLRTKVFVVEQNCVFQDMDDKDQEALHVLGYHNGDLVAYSRLLPAGVSYPEMAIGRVLTDTDRRKEGFGISLMKQSIETMYQAWGHQPIRIGAQLYLKKFYESFGFTQSSDTYLEDGIPHIEMLLP